MNVRPTLITSEDQLVALLRGRRIALGISQQALDDYVGCPDDYVAKIEAPGRRYGRRVAWGLAQTLFWWLDALGLTLMLVDKTTANDLATNSDAPPMEEANALVYAGRKRNTRIVAYG